MADKREVLRRYQPVIRQHLIPSQLLPNLITIDSIQKEGVCNKILMHEANGGREQACNLLVDTLIDSEDLGWYKIFITALKEKGFEILARTIEGFEDVKNQKIYLQLIGLFYPELCGIDTPQVLPHLMANGCINEQDQEIILSTCRTKGNHWANLNMLNILPKKSEDWFAGLMYALKKSDNDDLVETIEPKMAAVGPEKTREVANKIHSEYVEYQKNAGMHDTTMRVKEIQLTDDDDVYNDELSLQSGSSTDVKQRKGVRYLVKIPDPHPPLELDLKTHTSSFIKEHSAGPTPGETSSFSNHYTSEGIDPGLEGANDHPPNKKIKADGIGTRLPPIGQEAESNGSEQAGASASSPLVAAVNNDSNRTQMNNINVPTGTKNFDKPAFNSEEVQQQHLNPVSHNAPVQNSTERENPSWQGTSSETLQLRGYQTELALPAINGENSLIVAPTGSGKTHVAMYITKNHLETSEVGETPKILFIVPTVTLVVQQEEQFRKYLSRWKINKVFGDGTTDASLRFLLPIYDILVITPQILVDALGKKEIESLDCFSLLIFDECHHTMKAHPYNAIMSCYFQEKSLNKNKHLPQIVGMTASVGVGKATTVDSACDHILKLCANLDADIHSVQSEVIELKKFVNVPMEESHEVRGRREDPFHQIINNLMSQVEKKMDSAPEIRAVTDVSDFRKNLQPPTERGCDSYTQWISRLRRPVAKIFDQKTRRVFVACMNHLKTYNEALLLNADCRSKDALNHIKKTFGEFKEAVPYHDETDVWLDKIFQEKEVTLLRISQDPRNDNPKLLKMKELLLNQYRETPDLRAIIFCKTRDLTIALENWILEDKELAKLNPSQLVGANVSGDRGGMTQQKQSDVVKFFRSGKHKVILATTVAEEGLDIKKCNMVIRYEHVTNETARIQSKGRGRDEDSKYMLVADKGSSALSKEQINQAREELMYKAIAALLKMSVEEIQSKKQNFQEREQAKRKTKEIQQLALASCQDQSHEDDYELRCMKCDAFACFSFDMCIAEESMHLVISQEFMDAIKMESHPRPERGSEYIKKVGKISCVKCNYDWGIQVVYESLKFPCIKISSFVLIDSQGKRETCKKWKDSPFNVRAITLEDQIKMSELQ